MIIPNVQRLVAINVKARGFSLLELLVVLLIIGLGFSLVSVNVDNNTDKKMLIQAKQFANRTALIAEQAVLSNEQWGVDIYRQPSDSGEEYGYRWLARTNDKQWVLAENSRESTDFLFDRGIGLILELSESQQEFEIPAKRKMTEEKPLVANDTSVIDELATQKLAATDQVQPALWLLSSGEISAFRLTLYDQENVDSQVVVVGDELGRVVVETAQDSDFE